MSDTAAAPATDTLQGNFSIHDAAAAMDAADRTAKAALEKQPPAAQATSTDTDKADEAPVGEGGVDEDVVADGEEPEAAEAEAPADDDDDDPTVALADGTEIKLSEMAKGYLRQSDYTKKTQALAEERKTLDSARKDVTDKARQVEENLTVRLREAEAAVAAAAARRDEWDRRVQEYDKAVASQRDAWSTFDWNGLQAKIDNALAQGDQFAAAQASAEYTSAYAKYQQHQRAEQSAQAERAKIQSERDAEKGELTAKEQAALQQQDQEARTQLVDHISAKYPALVDPATSDKTWGEMKRTLTDMGFKPHQVANIHHFGPVNFDLVWKATQYDILTREKTGVTQRKADGTPAAPAGVRIVKGNAPRPRPLTVERARMGGTQAAFNANPSFENGLAAYNAAMDHAQKRR
jgi:hypothetical protein